MKNIFNIKLLYIIFLSIIIIVLLFYVYKLIRFIKNEKRVAAYTIDKKQEEKSIIDEILNIFYALVDWLSQLLVKSKYIKKYSKNLDKYLIYKRDKRFKSIDFISIKILIMILIEILYIVSIFIKYLDFNILAFLFVSIVSFYSVDLVLIYNFYNYKKQIEEQLLQAVVIMNSAFKSGKNISQAIDIVKTELPSPIEEEFTIVAKDLSYGLDLTTVFTRFSNRVNIEEAKYITSSLALLSKTGGNIVTVFNMIERNFFERLKIRSELNALTSSSKYMYRFLLVIPFIFVIVIVCLNPSYFSPLLTTPLGRIVIFVMLVLYVLYILIIKKVMKVDKV